MDTHTEFCRQAGLVVLGRYVQRLGLWADIEQRVHIPQKVHCHSPTAKLLDAFITILAGGALVTILQAPIVGLLLLVALKTGLDLRLHMREHRADVQPSLHQGD